MISKDQLKAAVVSMVEEKGNGVSFVELGEIEGFKGKYRFQPTNEKVENIVIWTGMSSEASDAIFELFMGEVVDLKPTSLLVYVADGAYLQLPIAKKLRKYKKLRWLPCTLYKGKNWKGV